MLLLTGVTVPGESGPTTVAVREGLFAAPDGSAGEVLHLPGAVVLPGLVDQHVHGGGGHDLSASPEDLDAGVAFHHRHGTAATLVSLVTAPVDALCRQLGWIADRCERPQQTDGVVLGAHLEGPFLSHARCGAQNPDFLIEPDRGALAELIASARGHLKMVTLAPELPGALDLVDDLLAAGVLVAVGHTDASYEQIIAALDRGATIATHLFNGMRPIHHREPGPVVAALERRLACELINDGVHLHPATVRLARENSRPVFVTDAMDATGLGDGHYALGGQDVVVADGQARLARNGSLAGSTLTMDRAAARALRDGWSVVAVAAATSTTTAELLGVADRYGSLAPGRPADAAVLGHDGELLGRLVGGEWEPAPPCYP